MFTPRNLLILAVTGAALVLSGIVAMPIDILGAQSASAKNGNGGGNGNAGGNSGGNSNGASNAASTDHGNSASAPGQLKPTQVETTASANAGAAGNPAAVGNGKLKVSGPDPRIGALHAVNANLQAFIHASPNSRVGRIAAYAQAFVAIEGAQDALTLAQQQLADATIMLADATTAHDDALQALVDTFSYADTSSATLLANQTTLEAIDPLLLTPAQADELAAINLALDNEQALSDATTAFDSANQAATDAETALADAEAAATDALAAAANKPIDDEVRNYVDTVLKNDGILDYYRAP